MIQQIIQQIINFFRKKEEKVDPPENSAIIKISDVAKESGVYDDENKIIERKIQGRKENIKYSEAEVESLREQGIPVVDEVYSDDYEFVNTVTGGVDYFRHYGQ